MKIHKSERLSSLLTHELSESREVIKDLGNVTQLYPDLKTYSLSKRLKSEVQYVSLLEEILVAVCPHEISIEELRNGSLCYLCLHAKWSDK
jgi:hypothetical protein